MGGTHPVHANKPHSNECGPLGLRRVRFCAGVGRFHQLLGAWGEARGWWGGDCKGRPFEGNLECNDSRDCLSERTLAT